MVTANAPVGLPPKRDYINFSSDSSYYGSEREIESESKQANASPTKIPKGEENEDVPFEFMDQSGLESGEEDIQPANPLNRRA